MERADGLEVDCNRGIQSDHAYYPPRQDSHTSALDIVVQRVPYGNVQFLHIAVDGKSRIEQGNRIKI